MKHVYGDDETYMEYDGDMGTYIYIYIYIYT